MALSAMRRFKPDYACVAWDKPKTNIRKAYPPGGRTRTAPAGLLRADPVAARAAGLWLPLYELDDCEADDIMGTRSGAGHQTGYRNHADYSPT